MIDIKWTDRVFVDGTRVSKLTKYYDAKSKSFNIYDFDNDEHPAQLVVEHNGIAINIPTYALHVREDIQVIEVWAVDDSESEPSALVLGNTFVNIIFDRITGDVRNSQTIIHIIADDIPDWFNIGGEHDSHAAMYPLIWTTETGRCVHKVKATEPGQLVKTVIIVPNPDSPPVYYRRFDPNESNALIDKSHEYIETLLDKTHHSAEGIVPGAIICLARNYTLGYEKLDKDFAVIESFEGTFPKNDSFVNLNIYNNETGPYTVKMRAHEFFARYRGVHSPNTLVVNVVEEYMLCALNGAFIVHPLETLKIKGKSYEELKEILNNKFEPRFENLSLTRNVLATLKKILPFTSVMFEVNDGDYGMDEVCVNDFLSMNESEMGPKMGVFRGSIEDFHKMMSQMFGNINDENDDEEEE